MKVFLVNLDRDTDRLASVDRQLKRLGVAYERVPAVYGKDLPADSIKAHCNAFRWWCAIGRPPSLGEIGCALSHFKIYERMLAEGISAACIIEDDIALSSSFASGLEKVADEIDESRSQVVLLSDHSGLYSTRQSGKEFEIVKSAKGMCTDGYCLTQLAARALLKQNRPIIVPCDMWKRWACKGVIELFHLLPSVCRQDESFGSYTTIGRVAVDSLSTANKIWYKLNRLLGKTVDFILLILTGK